MRELVSLSLPEIIEHRARRTPDGRAYSFLRDGEGEADDITYAELESKTRRLAAGLTSCASRGSRVLLVLPGGIRFIVAYLACLRAGLVAVPVPVPRRNRANERLARIIGDCQPSLALVPDAAAAQQYPALFESSPGLTWISMDTVAAASAGELQRPHLDDVAMLQYTSGSTAWPKGVVLTHANLIHNQSMIDASFGLGADDVVLGWLPLFHDMGLMGIALHPLYKGIPSILFSPEQFLQRPLRWLAAISRYDATTSGAPNFAYELCRNTVRDEELAGLDLSRWRIAFSGAERVRSQTLKRFASRFRSCGFRSRAFLPCYGMAESTLMITGKRSQEEPVVVELDRNALHAGHAARAQVGAASVELVGVGRSLLDESIVIMDPQTATALPEGFVGEVCVASDSVSARYWRADMAVHPAASSPERRPHLRTGDLGFLLDGELFITGRLKDLIIQRGRNVCPEDVEIAVEAVVEPLAKGNVAAFSIEVADEERTVVAIEMGSAAADVDFGALAQRVRSTVAECCEVELHAVLALRRLAIPRTSSGKLRRGHTRELWRSGQLEVLQEWVFEQHSSAPAEVFPGWQTVLAGDRSVALGVVAEDLRKWLEAHCGVSPPRERTNDPRLLELGLGSLQITRLLHYIEARFGVTLPLPSLFRAESLVAIADRILHVAATASGGAGCAVGESGSGSESRFAAPVRLSSGQAAIWLAQSLRPAGSSYHVARAAEVATPLDEERLARALGCVLDKHALLRVSLSLDETGHPVQQIEDVATVDFEVMRYASDAERAELMRAEAQRPFDFSRPPLLRVRVLRSPERLDLLLIVVHHIVCDLWSLSVLLGDIFEAYEVLGRGEVPHLAATADYIEHVREEERRTGSQENEHRQRFWRNYLAGSDTSSSSEVPGHEQDASAASFTQELPAELVHKLRAFASARGASLQMLLLAALEFALATHEGREDFLVCTLESGRTRAAHARTVGYFVNLLPLRVRIPATDSFERWLTRLRDEVLEAYSNTLPFECIARELPRYAFVMQDEGAAPNDEFTAFALGQAGGQLQLGSATLTSVRFEEPEGQFALALYAGVHRGGLICSFRYLERNFDESSVQSIANTFVGCLEGCLGNDGRHRVSVMPLLDAGQEAQLVRTGNDTQDTTCLVSKSLIQLFEAQRDRTPDRIAIDFEESSLTYAAFDSLAGRIATALIDRGVIAETVVGVCLPRGIEMVATLYAILKAGGAYLPLEPAYPDDYLKRVVRESTLGYVVTSADLLERRPTLFNDICAIDVAVASQAAASPVTSADALPGQLAYVIYTSGSTGAPKGAMNTHEGVCNRLLWMQKYLQLQDDDVVLQKTPFSFDVSVWELFWPLQTGARLVLARPDGHRDSAYLVDLIDRKSITVLHFVPSMLRAFLAHESVSACSLIRTVVCSGEALPTALGRALSARLTARLENLYGPTEAAIDVTAQRFLPAWQGALQPIGLPISNLRMHVLNPAIRLVPLRAIGRLFIGGIGLARGYLNRPALTAERFVPDPFASEPGARLYDTGDLGRRTATGVLEYLGRRDGQVKVRGFRIELGDIEAALGECPGVEAAAVDVRQVESPRLPELCYAERAEQAEDRVPLLDYRPFLRGELVRSAATDSSARLVAFCVMKQGTQPEVEAIQDWVRTRLPEHMVPSVISFVPELPLTSNGKLDRRRLREIPASLVSGVPAAQPSTDVEKILVEVWEDVLHVRGVGLHENFFALGGDSILSLQVIAKARRRGLHFDLPTLFSAPTVGALAALARTRPQSPQFTGVQAFSLLSEADRRLVPSSALDAFPLTKMQAGLIYHDDVERHREVYKDVFLYEIEGPFVEAALRSAVAHVIARHEALRTSIDLTTFSVPVQLVHASAEASLDLCELPDEAEFRTFIAAQRRIAFDWTRPPFIRFAVRLRSASRFDLIVTFHDLLLDGWSTSLLVSELLDVYDRLLRGAQAVSATPPRVRFADYVAAEIEANASGEAAAHFNRYLAGAPALQFPRREVAANDRAPFRVLDVPIPKSLSDGLKRLASSLGVGVKHVLLAAHVRVMCQLFGQWDVTTGLESNGRLDAEDGEAVIGMHLNTVPFRVDCRARSTWRELVRQVFVLEQSLLPVRRYSYANLQRAHGKGDLVDTVFNYVHFHAFRRLAELRQVCLRGARGYGASHFSFRSEFSLDPFSERVHLCLECNTQVVGQSLAREAGRYFAATLHSMVLDPEAHVAVQSLAAPASRRVHEGGAEGARWMEAWERAVLAGPDRAQLVYGWQVLSAASLWKRAHVGAQALRSAGVHAEGRVAILVSSALSYTVAILATHLAGGAYVPLALGQPDARIRKILAHQGIGWLLTDRDSLQQSLSGLRVLHPRQLEWIPDEPISLPPWSAIPAEQLSYVIHTSGSSGEPKGVMVTHRNLWYSLRSRLEFYQDAPCQAFLLIPGFSFDSSVAVIFTALVTSHRLVLPEQGVTDLQAIQDVIEREKVTHLLCTPSYYRALLTEAHPHTLGSLRVVIVAGEPLSARLVKLHFETLPQADLFNEYGPSEGSVWSTVHRCAPGEEAPIPIGRPRNYAGVDIVDAKGLACTAGQLGELVLSGECVARGYDSRPSLTADAFRPDFYNAEDGARCYSSGDMAWQRPDGAYSIAGRIDRQVKINGIRVEIGEIENAVASLEGVLDCAVIIEAPQEQAVQIIAYVATPAAAWLADRPRLESLLPRYMIPHRFLVLEALPTNDNGKVDYRALQSRGEALAAESRIRRLLAHVEALSEDEADAALAALKTD